jgi:hypothetical protein
MALSAEGGRNWEGTAKPDILAPAPDMNVGSNTAYSGNTRKRVCCRVDRHPGWLGLHNAASANP